MGLHFDGRITIQRFKYTEIKSFIEVAQIFDTFLPTVVG